MLVSLNGVIMLRQKGGTADTEHRKDAFGSTGDQGRLSTDDSHHKRSHGPCCGMDSSP